MCNFDAHLPTAPYISCTKSRNFEPLSTNLSLIQVCHITFFHFKNDHSPFRTLHFHNLHSITRVGRSSFFLRLLLLPGIQWFLACNACINHLDLFCVFLSALYFCSLEQMLLGGSALWFNTCIYFLLSSFHSFC